ncbi:MAG: hypothetical protein HYW65_00235 [Candidatus Liptonbacteria bacterium]|nr:hypothetical protein [Candidatus Liptonbacteria bacterium]
MENDLTGKEKEVLVHVASGEADSVTANHLKVSMKMIDKHRGDIVKKLRAQNAAYNNVKPLVLMVHYAIGNGIVACMFEGVATASNTPPTAEVPTNTVPSIARAVPASGKEFPPTPAARRTPSPTRRKRIDRTASFNASAAVAHMLRRVEKKNVLI